MKNCLCRVLKVSESGYYRWLRNRSKATKRQLLPVEILKIIKEKLYRLPISSMTRAEVRTVIFRYIFGYYNTQRVTSFNPGGLPPTMFRQLKAVKPTVA